MKFDDDTPKDVHFRGNVKVLRQTDRQMDGRTDQKQYAPDLSMQGHENKKNKMC